MTQALCLRCGDIKFGAYCDCYTCGAPAIADQKLSIALSDHHLPHSILERFGKLVRDLAAGSSDGDVRHAAFLLALRAMPEAYHRDVAPHLEERARALLATVSVPTINITEPWSGAQWASALTGRSLGPRGRFWEAVMMEVARNRALVVDGGTALDAADLTVVGDEVRALHDAALVVGEGDADGVRRARHVVIVVSARRARLETLGTHVVALRAGDFTGPPVILESVPELSRSALRRHVRDARLHHDGVDYPLASLVDVPARR